MGGAGCVLGGCERGCGWPWGEAWPRQLAARHAAAQQAPAPRPTLSSARSAAIFSCSFSICPWCPLGTDRWWLQRMATLGGNGGAWRGGEGAVVLRGASRAAQALVERSRRSTQVPLARAHLLVSPVVRRLLPLHRVLRHRLGQQAVQRDGGVVGTEDLRAVAAGRGMSWCTRGSASCTRHASPRPPSCCGDAPSRSAPPSDP